MGSFDDDRWPEHDNDGEVGYGNPPKHSRFKKGQSGNPSGKPGAKNHSALLLRKALLRPLPVKQAGRRRRFTKLQAFATQLVNQATQGNYQSIRLLLSYCTWLHSELTEPSRQGGGLSPEEGEAIRRALLGLPDQDDNVAAENSSSVEHAPSTMTLEGQAKEEEQRTRPSEVGFGRPPVRSRFRKGQSGNPAGRPPVVKTFARLLRRLLLEKVRMTENGCPRTVTRLEVIFDQIVNRAALGNARFQRLLIEYIRSVDIALDRNRKPPKNLVRRLSKSLYESINSDDWQVGSFEGLGWRP